MCERSIYLRDRADKCRRHASAMSDAYTQTTIFSERRLRDVEKIIYFSHSSMVCGSRSGALFLPFAQLNGYINFRYDLRIPVSGIVS